MKIEGKKIYLTPITIDDAPDIVRWRNSDIVRNQFIYRKDFTLEGQISWINEKVASGDVVQFIIFDKETNKKIGSVYFQDIDRNHRKCEFGIFIGEKDFLGKGLGSEVAKIATDYMLNEMNMHKVYLRLLASNTRAYHSYQNAGYEKEGLFKDDVFINGAYYDVIFMAKHKSS